MALASPDRLSPTALKLIEDPQTEILVSAATAWEIATKYRLGRLAGADAIVHRYQSHLVTLRAREMPVLSTHALTAGMFAVVHCDPFDRMLAAQAITENVPLITNDPHMESFPGLVTRW